MRALNASHRRAAAELKMPPGDLADMIDSARISIRKNFADSADPRLRYIARLPFEELDEFLHEIFSGPW